MSLFKKSGGGYLNGVNGILEAIKFDTKVWGEGDDAYTTFTAELLVKQDGAEEAVQQFLPAGFLYEGHTISADGSTIEGGDDEDAPVVAENSEFGKFVASAIEKGVPESDFPENGRNFDALLGFRYTFVKAQNVERQMAAGKKKLGKAKAAAASTEEIMLAGRRQDKTDKKKFYNHDMLLVGAVLGAADEAPAKGKGKAAAGKAAAKPAAGAKGGKKGAAEEVDYTDADVLLCDLLKAAKDKTIKKSALSSLIVRKALEDDMDEDTRDNFRKLLSDDAFLGREAGWTFDADDKNKPVTLKKK